MYCGRYKPFGRHKRRGPKPSSPSSSEGPCTIPADPLFSSYRVHTQLGGTREALLFLKLYVSILLARQPVEAMMMLITVG